MTFPFASGAAAGFIETGAAYVGGQLNFSTSSTLSTLGAASGDLLIIYDPAGSSSLTLSSGNALTSIGTAFHTRVLNSGDVAGTISASGSGASCVIYRGAASAAVVDTDSSAGAASSKDAGGFTKNAAHVGIVGTVQSATGSSTCSIGAPASFATRLNGATSVSAASTLHISDRLQPVNPIYVNGTSILWNSSGSSNLLRVVELRA